MDSDKELLERLAEDYPSEHDIEECGLCFHRHLMAKTAEEIAATENPSMETWHREVRKRWQEGKYYKLWQQARAEGKDPEKVFEERGWEA